MFHIYNNSHIPLSHGFLLARRAICLVIVHDVLVVEPLGRGSDRGLRPGDVRDPDDRGRLEAGVVDDRRRRDRRPIWGKGGSRVHPDSGGWRELVSPWLIHLVGTLVPGPHFQDNDNWK